MINRVKKTDIIVLNGASSSGKTSLAKALQNLLSPTYLYLALDTFGDMFPDNYIDVENEDLSKARKNKILFIMLRSVQVSNKVKNKRSRKLARIEKTWKIPYN